jgi:hypothetical protein
MAKGQVRSNREIRKPKADKPSAPISVGARNGGSPADTLTHIAGKKKNAGYLDRNAESAVASPRRKG